MKVFYDAYLHAQLCAFLPGYTWHVEWDSIGQQYIIKAREIQDDG